MNPALPVRMVEKPWGRSTLPPPFSGNEGRQIGEIWFEPPPSLPELLVKYIFTSEALSVQVHPSGAQRPGHGKEECWLVIDAEPGARLGIGFGTELGPEQLRSAALDGSIEHLMIWHPVTAGDFFYIPANTVHAIGAGISLIEVQQNSDITYRLYDYGRPRELHLDEALAVAQAGPYSPRWHCHIAPTESASLVQGPLFRLDQVIGAPEPQTAAVYDKAPVLVIPRRGEVHVNDGVIAPGQCGLAASLAAASFPADGCCLIAQPCTS